MLFGGRHLEGVPEDKVEEAGRLSLVPCRDEDIRQLERVSRPLARRVFQAIVL